MIRRFLPLAAACVAACSTARVTAQIPAPVNPPPMETPAPAPAPAPTGVPAAAAPAATAAPPAAEDPGLTAGGALQAFMASRNYRSIRALRAIMTPALQARFDHDSTPFNGKRTIRIGAFDFGDKDFKAAKTGGAFAVTVRTVWEDQGEAVEKRTETIGVQQQPNGVWRVSSLERTASESTRYIKNTDGVTSLRMLLRAWQRGDARSAETFFSPALAKRAGDREGAAAAVLGLPDPAAAVPPNAAFEIVDMTPRGEATLVARVRLYRGFRDRPSPFETSEHTLRLIQQGPKWQLDDWN